jgi:hypothetical protein
LEGFSVRSYLEKALPADTQGTPTSGGEVGVLLAPSGRCGSTWLSQLLDAHPQISLKVEPIRQQLPYSNPVHPLAPAVPPSDRAALSLWEGQGFALHWWQNFSRWLRETPGLTMIKETNLFFRHGWVKSLLPPSTRWVVLNRDLRGVVSSFRRRNLYERWGYADVFESVARSIRAEVRLAEEYLPLLTSLSPAGVAERLAFLYCVGANEIAKALAPGEFHYLHYEGLLANPRRELGRLRAYLGLDACPETDEFLRVTRSGQGGASDMSIIKHKEKDDWGVWLEQSDEDAVWKVATASLAALAPLRRLCETTDFRCLTGPRVAHRAGRASLPAPQGWGAVTDHTTLAKQKPSFGDARREVAGEIVASLVPVPTVRGTLEVASALVTNRQFCGLLNWLAARGVGNTLQGHFLLLNAAMIENSGGRVFEDGTGFAVLRGFEEHPVNWVTYLGARLFAAWAGARLLTADE